MSVNPLRRTSDTSWFGEIPNTWKQLRTKIIFFNHREKKKEGDDQLSATQKFGVIPQKLSMANEDTRVMLALAGTENFKHVDRDDFVISLRSFEGGIERCFYDGCVSPAYTVMKAQHPSDPGYFQYLFKSRAFINEMQLGVYGIRDGKAVNFEDVARIRLPYPSLADQTAIAAYLDAETKRIDWLVKEKENLLKLLVELRGGIIRALTAGIDLGSSMQETGNVFMPVIPSNWGMSGIGRFSNIGNGSTPLKDNADYWEGGTYPWLNSSVVNNDEVTEGSELVTENALRQCHLPIVQAGSVLVALTGQGKTRGQATMLRIEATINQHLAYIQTDGERLDGEYLFWVLSGQFNALRMISDGQGGTKGALTCDDLRKFQIPLPPIGVQKEIAARLYEDTRRVDELVEFAKNEIEVLAELRSSTITDAVLGRIDVRKSQTH